MQRGVESVDLDRVLTVGVGAVEREVVNLFSKRVEAGGDRAVRAPWGESMEAFAHQFGALARSVIGLKTLFAARAARDREPIAEAFFQFFHQPPLARAI